MSFYLAITEITSPCETKIYDYKKTKGKNTVTNIKFFKIFNMFGKTHMQLKNQIIKQFYQYQIDLKCLEH